MQAILYGHFRFNPRQCSVMQSGEVKHSLQQSSAVKCIAVWSSAVLSRSLQSSPIYSSQVSSMQVHCSVFPSGTTQVNISQLQQCSVVLSSPVQSSPVPLTEVHCSVFQSGTQCRPQCIPAETSEVQPRAVRCHP